jgi:hypothetical protein
MPSYPDASLAEKAYHARTGWEIHEVVDAKRVTPDTGLRVRLTTLQTTSVTLAIQTTISAKHLNQK